MRGHIRLALALVVAVAAANVHPSAASKPPCSNAEYERLSKLLDVDEKRIDDAQAAYDKAQVDSANFFLEKGRTDENLDHILALKRVELGDSRAILKKDHERFEDCLARQKQPLTIDTPQPLDTGNMNDEPAYTETFQRDGLYAHVRAAQGFRWMTLAGATELFEASGFLWLACPKPAASGGHAYECNFTFKIPDPKYPGAEDRGIRIEGRATAALMLGQSGKDDVSVNLVAGGVLRDFNFSPPHLREMGADHGDWKQVQQ